MGLGLSGPGGLDVLYLVRLPYHDLLVIRHLHQRARRPAHLLVAAAVPPQPASQAAIVVIGLATIVLGDSNQVRNLPATSWGR